MKIMKGCIFKRNWTPIGLDEVGVQPLGQGLAVANRR